MSLLTMNSRARQILLTPVGHFYSLARRTFFFDWRISAWFIAWIFLVSGSLFAGESATRAVAAADPRLLRNGWHLVTDLQGIQVYNRPWPHSAIPEALARAVIRVPPKRLGTVITDYDHFAEFIPYVTSSRILRQEGATCYVHQHLHFPGPLADRHYTIASNALSRPWENTFRVEWHLVPENGEAPSREKGITPSAFDGFWDLTPDESGLTTEAVYSIHFDPGGALPSWLVTMAMNRYLPRVVEAVRIRALPSAAGDTRKVEPVVVKQP